MDFLPSLLNFEDLDDLQLHFPSVLLPPDDQQEDIFQESILLTTAICTPPLLLLHDSPNHNSNNNNNLVEKAETCKERQSSAVTFDQNENPNIDQNKKRKLLHRNVERQRRQDMSKLYDSLRATLPSHCTKGKRSVSDHMDEAVKYIQVMQKKIEDLKKRRYKLNGISPRQSQSQCQSPVISPKCCKLAAGDDECVTVNGCKELGMEVIVNSPMKGGGGGGEGHFRLSRIFSVLIDQGLTILCCVSSKANDRLIHTIQSEVNDGRSIDPTELQKRLTNLLVSGYLFPKF